jgi:hypothetical protein
MEYLIGTDAEGNLRLVKVPAHMSEVEASFLVELALEPPYGRVTTISLAEIKRLAGAL